jgi:dissimilatory sulfite reductase (desulfoviridin) alpha/beta subunit
VFARGRVLDGLVDLMFHSWEVDRLGERVLIPYHVKISLEGLPNTCGR